MNRVLRVFTFLIFSLISISFLFVKDINAATCTKTICTKYDVGTCCYKNMTEVNCSSCLALNNCVSRECKKCVETGIYEYACPPFDPLNDPSETEPPPSEPPVCNETVSNKDRPKTAPEYITFKIGLVTYTLSKDINNPTVISKPTKQLTNSLISSPIPPEDSITKDISKYRMLTNVEADTDIWNGTTKLIQNDMFVEEDYVVNRNYFGSGDSGSITTQYFIKSSCSDTRYYSPETTGFFKINNEPNIENLNSLVSTTLNTTPTNCEGQYITGKELNNPLPVTIKATDTDGLDEIQTLSILFSVRDNPPTISKVFGLTESSTTPLTNTNNFGVMIRKDPETGWDNPRIYITKRLNDTYVWKRGSQAYLNNSLIYSVDEDSLQITQTTDIEVKFNIKFESNDQYLTNYNIFVQSLDQHMYTQDTPGTIEQPDTWEDSGINWAIDTVDPIIENINTKIKSITDLQYTWEISDANTSVTRVFGDVYLPDTAEKDNILNTRTGVTYSPISLSLNQEIPIPDINIPHLWNTLNTTTDTEELDIGLNKDEYLRINTVAFDQACNYTQQYEDIDLSGWFATKGGIAYTQDKPSFSIPDLSSVIWEETSPKGFDPLTTDMSDRLTTIGSYEDFQNRGLGATVYGISPVYSFANSNVYTNLIEGFEQRKDSMQEMVKTENSFFCSSPATTCYYQSTEDIYIPEGFVCNKNFVFISSSNIHVHPNTSSSDTGCFFLAENIYLDNGVPMAGDIATLYYESFDGFFIANNQIISSSDYSGLEVNGSLISLGDGSVKGLDISRKLQLYNLLYPSLTVTHNPKYMEISKDIFGTMNNVYKQEVGFKAL